MWVTTAGPDCAGVASGSSQAIPFARLSQMNDSNTKLSKFLSYVLRHRPQAIGLQLGDGGWVAIEALIAAAARHGKAMTFDRLLEVVATDSKRRYAFNADRTMIRAVQGHSVEVDLGYAPASPPAVLFHGTVERFVAAILREGIRRGRRHHVHLSADRETAGNVGARRGQPVILTIDAAAMHGEGHAFYRADNGVWLVDHVPPRFLALDSGASEDLSP